STLSPYTTLFRSGCPATVHHRHPFPLMPWFQCARPSREFAAGTLCNTVLLIRCSGFRGSLGDDIADVIASAYLSAAFGAITRCAMLIPAPAMLACSFKSVTSRTGPL